MRRRLVALLLATSSCMSLVRRDEQKHPTRAATIFDVIALGLLGDTIVATSGAAIHAYADKQHSFPQIFPFYAGPLVVIDTVLVITLWNQLSN
jgi:hypothetical protein